MELLFDHAVVCRTFDGGILARDQLPDGGFHLFLHRDGRQLGDAFDHRALSFSSSRSTITTTKVASCSTPLAGLAVKVVDGFFLVGPLQRRCRPRAQFATPEGAFVVRRVYANQRRATIGRERRSRRTRVQGRINSLGEESIRLLQPYNRKSRLVWSTPAQRKSQGRQPFYSDAFFVREISYPKTSAHRASILKEGWLCPLST